MRPTAGSSAGRISIPARKCASVTPTIVVVDHGRVIAVGNGGTWIVRFTAQTTAAAQAEKVLEKVQETELPAEKQQELQLDESARQTLETLAWWWFYEKIYNGIFIGRFSVGVVNALGC